MCRNIRTLHNFEPPATEDEVQAAAVQFVRKVSGSTRPSKANQETFDRAVREVAEETGAEENRQAAENAEVEAAKARARTAARYA